MKQHIKIPFLTTVLFLIVSGNFSAQVSNSSGSGSPIIVTIDKFKMDSGDPTFKYFEKAISDILAIGLINDSRIKFIDREILERANPSEIMQDQFEQRNIGLDLTDANIQSNLNVENVESIVTGNFNEYKGWIKIDTRLIDNTNEEYFKNSTKFRRVEETIFILDELTQILIGKIQVSNSSGSGSPIIVTIDKFKMDSGDPTFKYFEKAISDILAIGLINDSRIKFIDREILERANPSEIMQDQFEQRNIGLDLTDANIQSNLNVENVESIVTGNFNEYKGWIKIDTRLIDNTNEEYFKNSTKFRRVEETIFILDELTQILIGKIIEHSGTQEKTQSIGVVCFKPDATRNSLVDSIFIENIAYSLSLKLRSNKHFKPLLWNKTSEHCNSDDGYNVIIDKIEDDVDSIKVDVILSGKYYIDAQYNNVSIDPILYINEFDKEYELASVKASYFEIGELLSSQVFDALNNLIDDNGEWKLEPLEFSTTNYKEYLQKSEAYINSNDLYFATLMSNKAIELNPDTLEAYILLGLIQEKQRRFKSALQTFEYVYEQNPGFEKLNYYIGKTYLNLDKPDLAIEKLNEALGSNPEDREIYKVLGQAYVSLNDTTSAIAILNKALEINPDDSRIKSSLGYYHTQIGLDYYSDNKYEDAKQHLYEAKELRPKSKRVNNLLIKTLNRLDDFDEVDILIAEGLREGILDSSKIYLENGVDLRLISNEGEFSKIHLKEALKYLKKHVELFPDNSVALSRLGTTYFRLDEFDNAAIQYERATMKDSENIGAHLNLIEVRIIIELYQKTLESVEKVLELTSNDPKEIDSRAICYYFKIVALKLLDKDYNKAWNELQRILDAEKTIYTAWSFKTFRNWVDQSDLDSDDKDFIIEKTDYMEEETWSLE